MGRLRAGPRPGDRLDRLYTEELRTATDAILSDLIFGGAFDVQVNGQPVLEAREQAHMSDVRSVFRGLWVLAAISIGGPPGRDPSARSGADVAARSGTVPRVLAVGVVVLGVVALVAFDQLFETFHEIFFPPGSFLFDPRTDKLVQLFPFDFWQETAIVVGAVDPRRSRSSWRWSPVGERPGRPGRPSRRRTVPIAEPEPGA